MSRSRFTVTAVASAAAAATGLVLSVAAPAAVARGAHPAAAKHALGLKVASVRLSAGSVHGTRRLLVDAAGMPVYMLSGDTTSHPKCLTASCQHVWPAVTAGGQRPALGKGVHGKLTVWHHKGVAQLALNGHPLYTFYADKRGAAYGAGIKSFGGVWDAVQATGAPMAMGKGHKGSSGSGW